MKKNYMISYARIIAIFLVVLGHVLFIFDNGYSWIITGNYPKYNSIMILRKIIYAFHMAAFFVISGYLFKFSITNNEPKIFIKKRINRLLLPFIFFKYCVYQPSKIIVNPVIYSGGKNTPFVNYLFDFDLGHLWFIITLFFIEMIEFIIHKFISKSEKTNMLWLLFTLIITILIGKIRNFIPNLPNNVMLYLFYFEFGYYLSKRQNIFKSIKDNILHIIAYIFIFSIFFILLISKNKYTSIIYVVLRITGTMSLLYFCDILSKITKNYKLSKLETLSMPIYLWHQCYLYIILKNWKWPYDWKYVIIVTSLCIILPILSSLILSALKLNVLDGGLVFRDKIKQKKN